MSEAPVVRKAIPQAQSTTSGHTQMTSRPLHITEPTASKRVCFYKSGDSQFSGLPVIINSRTFKTFEALLDSLSKRVPLPFGVRTITTPRGHTAVQSLDQLHHGHSYICSDRRTVKPIDLEQARRKLPPWYHARPVSARCLAWYTHSSAQHGTCSARLNEHAILLHTPKRLVLFRNGETEVKHTLILQRRKAYSFEALLDHMSEVMHFPVLRLHSPDGRRVDGLPALILCSGVLVAAGREPFKKRNYDIQKSSPPMWLPVKRLKRRHPIARKNKSSSTKSCPFSPSSEHYFVNQIQNTMSGSMYDFQSNPNCSVEVEPGQHLESVAETEVITSRDGEKVDDIHMPSDDDIEKAFRVNQDGSMTVEMKVRLTIKEEETIHWTTTVSRSSVYNQFKAATISCPDLDANLPDNLPPQSDTPTIEVSEIDPNDSNHFCPKDGYKVNEDTEISGAAASMELERLPSPLSHFPGLHKVQHKQESIESIKTVSDTEFHKNHSYSDTEELDSGDVKQEYCMVQQCYQPVPKPRCTLASEIHTTTRLQLSNYKCSENLQFQDNQKKMYEAPLHINEKQTCQENFSDKTQHHLQFFGSSHHEYDVKMAVTPVTTSSKVLVSKQVLTIGTTTKRKAVRVVVKKNHLLKCAIPKRRPRPNKADILKEKKKKRLDISSQKGDVKLNKNSTTKAAQKLLKRRNNNGNGNVPLKPKTEQLEYVQLKTDDLSSFLVEKDQNNIQVQAGSYTLPKTKIQKATLIKGTLSRHTSEYVELWLQRSTKVKPPLLYQPSLETIPKNNTMVKASLFNYQSCNSVQALTNEVFEEKEICVYSPKTKKPEQINSDHLTKTRENQQTSEPISKTDSYNTENTLRRPLGIHTKPSIELIDLQAQKFYNVKMAVRPDMKPVLDQLCYCIESLREITQHKWLCSKISICVADFSSYVESTFGTSSRVLLAFLCVMTLKDGLSHLNACGQADASLSCSEAMHMMQSLNELAAIEDAEQLRISLSNLHNSASNQLLQSWKDFQVLINKARCSNATPETTLSEANQSSSSEEEEHAIQMLTEQLGVPERVREELAALNYSDESIMKCSQIEDTDKVSESIQSMKMNGFSELHSKEKIDSLSDFVLEDCVNKYVNSVIDRAITAHLKDSDNSQVFVVDLLERPEKDIVNEDRYQQDLRNDNFYNTEKKIKGDVIPDSDICKDMLLGESSFETEMYRELENVEHKIQEEETFTRHQEKVEEMSRVESQNEITEGRGICKENSSKWENSESLKTVLKNEVLRKVVNKVEKDRDSVEEEGSKLSEPPIIRNEKVNKLDENVKYSDETFPKDKYFSKENNLNVKSPEPSDGAEQICSKETISGHWQNEFQAMQNQDQLYNKTKITEKGFVLSEVQDIPHNHIESNIEVDEIQHSITHQDFCMESMIYSEEEHVILEAPECYSIYQENCVEIPEEITEYKENENDFKKARATDIAKPISSLQDQEKSVSKRKYNTEQTTGKRLLNHISVTNQEASNIVKTTESGSMDSVSSSLAFSYDSKNSDLAKDSEEHIQTNRVKSIRDMFLAKSNTDMRHGQAQLSSPSSELSNYQLESSHRKEYQLLTSSELSREEKNTCRLSIAKGYVKRTIEQLYGKGSKGCSSDEKRNPSTDKIEKREGLRGTNASSLPSLHEVHTDAITDLSYFNATSSVDSLNEPMNCVTLNARVGPKDAVLIDKGRWLLRENQMSLKSCSENEDTSKKIEDKDVLAESEQDSGKENIPYSLFGHSSVMPDKDPSFTEQEEECPGRTITYFHLPDASDSEIQPNDQKTDTPKRKTENKVTPLTEPPKCWTEKHSFTPMDIKKSANKVHPVIETTSPVITQPAKGQSVEVTRHSAEPDALEILYMFCGQHCPIL
ncbi:oxygen-regulated protein 1-like [Carassius carassius]|uniref:oxygen-regulated protein 1-like n=1 Tax=Carassius carassius TaxID=217509 RepID=UPI00286928CB|nr:oxygen-regulated protein 1-like [Carassius carassius]